MNGGNKTVFIHVCKQLNLAHIKQKSQDGKSKSRENRIEKKNRARNICNAI